jgi:NAD(P)-dependent dehydrogenase (short-subunit alcohol dehydrogenase family)
MAGCTAVVGGGAGGIGLATTLELARNGATVHAIDANPDACTALEKAFATEALDGSVICADLGDADAVRSAVDDVKSRREHVSVLVNVAGRLLVRPYLDTAPEDWLALFRINVLSMVELTRQILPSMIAGGGGTIVNMASLSATLATPLESAYCVTKAAVRQLTRAVAVEFRDAGVRCNCVSPAMVDTALGQGEIASLRAAGVDLDMDAVAAGQGRFATADEIAKAIVFLAGDDSSFANGAELVLDNAWSAGAGA